MGKADWDTSNHAATAMCEEHINQMYTACFGGNREQHLKIDCKWEEKGRLLDDNGIGTGFEDGWGIYR